MPKLCLEKIKPLNFQEYFTIGSERGGRLNTFTALQFSLFIRVLRYCFLYVFKKIMPKLCLKSHKKKSRFLPTLQNLALPF